MFLFTISPDFDWRVWLFSLILGLALAVMLVLRAQYGGRRHTSNTPVVDVLIYLGVPAGMIWLGRYVVLPFEPESVLWASILISFLEVVVAAMWLHYANREMVNFGIMPNYDTHTLDNHDYHNLKYELYSGNEQEVLSIMMKDAMLRDQMSRFQKLSKMADKLQELELKASIDPGKKSDWYYERHFVREQLEGLITDATTA